MEANTKTGEPAVVKAHGARPKMLRNSLGFTLLELMIVMAIVGILATLAEPTFHTATVKAREAALKKDLFIFRDGIDQYYADQGVYPPSLKDLLGKKYLRAIPVDPFTKSGDTWVEVMAQGDEGESGVFDVHSGSDMVALDGTAYNVW
jgi:general secretion pathway protein G